MIFGYSNGGNRQQLLSILLVVALILVGMGGLLPAQMDAHAETDAQTYRVAPSGADNVGCGTSSAPCKTIQYAVNAAASGDTILVAGGTYTYNASADICTFLPSGGKSVVCIVDKTLAIVGGYSTSNWSTPNYTNNLTVIDGGSTYRGVFLLGYNTTTTNLRMEGFTIRNGKTIGPNTPGDPSGFGGGMIVSGAYVTLRDMSFLNNKVYGQNTTSGAGGAGAGAGMAINWSQPGTSSLIERVIFDGNQSFGGTGPGRGGVAFGALFINGSVTMRDATFTNNLASGGSSSGSGLSGGLHADALGGAIGGGGGNWILEKIVAVGNRAQGGSASSYAGGAFGGAINVETATNIVLRDSYIADNIAQGGDALDGGFGAGGGVLVNNTPGTIERVKIIHNSGIGGNSTGSGKAGAGGGGGLYLWRSRSDISASGFVVNSIIADNYVALGSSGTTTAGGGGGGVQVQGLHAEFNFTTIAYNRLGAGLVSGQGLLVLAAPGVGPASADVENSIIANHTEGSHDASAILVQAGNTINFNTGLFAGNTKNSNVDGLPTPAGVINGLNTMGQVDSIGFVAPNAPDWDFHINANSPAIDSGISSQINVDIDGDSRPAGGYPDIGADEFTAVEVLVSTSNVSVVADNSGYTGLVAIDIPADPNADWTATTSANWVNLGQSNVHQFSGQSGQSLTISLAVNSLPRGIHYATIEVSSPGAQPAMIQVTLVKVDTVHKVFLPIQKP